MRPRGRRRWAWLLGAVLLFAAALVSLPKWPGWYWSWRTQNPVRRGSRLASHEGCLGCHMPKGRSTFANPGSRWGSVPSFFRNEAMMYIKSPEEVAYFIAEGHAKHAPKSTAEAAKAPFHMPAFKEKLSARQIQDLAAFVLAADGDTVPSEGPVAKGAELSAKFGCESCHGVAGSGGFPNPRSFTGSVPGWTGPDFDDLVKDEPEFAQWVLKGRSERMKDNRAASFFLDRANIQMPAFGSAISPEDVQALWPYVRWLRSGETGGESQGAAIPPAVSK